MGAAIILPLTANNDNPMVLKTLKNLGKSNSLKLFKIENDPRYVSLGYLLEKLILIFPKISFLFKVLHKVRFFRNFSIKVNLGDLNIYYFIREK